MIDLDDLLRYEPVPPAVEKLLKPGPVKRHCERTPHDIRLLLDQGVPETAWPIMRFDLFRRAHEAKRHLTGRDLQRYRTMAANAGRARKQLRETPGLADWFMRRQILRDAGLRLDPTAAGPQPGTKAHREWAAEQERKVAENNRQNHEQLMTCEIPDPTQVRIGERSADAVMDRRIAQSDRLRILKYRKQQQALIDAEEQRQFDIDVAARAAQLGPGQTRESRIAWRLLLPYHYAVTEDLGHLADIGRDVRCARHPELLTPRHLRRHRS